MILYDILEAQLWSTAIIVAHEVVEQGDTDNWEKTVGTGAFMITEFVLGSSLVFSKNPNYWGYDERHPENQLPYIDSLKVLQINDMSTTLAAIRIGKIDMLMDPRDGLTWQQGKSLAKSNPEIQQGKLEGNGEALEFRCDKEPFTNINVRKALQMAIDRETIVKVYYGGTVDGKPCGTANPAVYKEWITLYDDWPQELKDEYSYNPERARELLAKAGFPEGFKTNCVIPADLEPALYEIIQGYFSEINVDMELIVLESVGVFDPFIIAGKHDQICAGGGTGLCFAPTMIIRTSYSGNTRGNYTYNNDSHYDDLVIQFGTTSSMEEAVQIFKEADLYSLLQHWILRICPIVTPIAWQPWIKGYSGELIFGNLWPVFYPTRLWIDQELKKSFGH